MKRYTMEDRSGGVVNRQDTNLSLQQVFEMTDYSEAEVDQIADLQVGQWLLIGSDQDVFVSKGLLMTPSVQMQFYRIQEDEVLERVQVVLDNIGTDRYTHEHLDTEQYILGAYSDVGQDEMTEAELERDMAITLEAINHLRSSLPPRSN